MAESRKAFLDLPKFAPENLQRRLTEFINSVAFRNELTDIVKTSGLSGAAQTYSVSNVTTDRAVNADSTTLNEVVDVLCTLIIDLRARGVIS